MKYFGRAGLVWLLIITALYGTNDVSLPPEVEVKQIGAEGPGSGFVVTPGGGGTSQL